MNYLSSKTVEAMNGSDLTLSLTTPVGLAGFIHSDPGGKTALLQVGAANYHGALGSLSYANNAGSCQFTKVAHGLAVDDYIFVTSAGGAITGIQQITAVTADTFTTDKTYAAGSPAVVYTGQMVFKVSTFTEFILEGVAGPFAAYEITHHASAGADTNLLWTYR